MAKTYTCMFNCALFITQYCNAFIIVNRTIEEGTLANGDHAKVQLKRPGVKTWLGHCVVF